MPKCPICNSETSNKITNTPYWDCSYCGCWWQDPLPEKIYEGQHEKDETGHSAQMSDYEKDINNTLAINIFNNHMNGKAGKCLDIGSKYPYLSKSFNDLGCISYGMDAINEVEEYSNELNIPMIFGDFEKLSVDEILLQTGGEKFNLITMIHMFEHLYNPVESLKKLKQLLTDDGVLFLRLPQHDVSGFERDLQESHYKIHPFYHSFSSILECLVQGEDLFTITTSCAMNGCGQRDIALKPIQKKPIIWAGMIVKNEERDLPKCLKTIQSVVDGIVIMDTGSTDNTQQAAKAIWNKPIIYETYTGASKQDDTGDWKLWDFGKARRQFIDKIEAMPEVDYLIWFDADDTLLTPANLKRAFYLNQYDHFGMMIETEGLRWVHHRAWKTKKGYTFAGKIHEYPVLNTGEGFILQDTVINHDAAPGIGEGSNERNLRILEAELLENPHDGRTAFYLANTHKDAERYLEASKYYDLRIRLGCGYWDEWITSYLYKGRCERAAGLLKEAEASLLEGLSHAPDWSELWMELGYMFYNINKYLCISYCMQAANRPNTPTQLWREDNKYTDQPRRLLSFCYQELGNTEEALKWAKEAKLLIPSSDPDWDNRIKVLSNSIKSNKSPEINTKKIAIHRPGAIGDIIMTLNLIPALKEKYPGYNIDYFCDDGIRQSLEPLFKLAGISNSYDFNSLPMVEFDYDHVFNMVGYPIPPKGNYPEEPMSKHLLYYFAEEAGLDLTPELPQLCIENRLEPLVSGPYITVHAQAGWSAYKNWSQDKWEELITTIQEQSEIPVKFIQIGAINDFKIAGCDHSFMGKPLMDSVNLISNAQLHMGVDSFSNHLTHIKWSNKQTPAVILWGSTQYTAAGYKENLNISLGLSCQPCFKEDPRISRQPRGLCINPEGQTSYENPQHACMSGITVERVLNEIPNYLKLS